MTSAGDFFSMYFEYTSNTEAPQFFHRWSAIAGIGAFLGRRYSFPFGQFPIQPNIYCMLVGNPGTRKSSAIKSMKYLLQQSGYNTIAASKTSKEKFLEDLHGELDSNGCSMDSLDNFSLLGDGSTLEDRECLIAADEFNNFIGIGNIEFISILGELWDYNGQYENRIKSGKSVKINNPTITILGGNTPTNIATAFPPEVIGQGFFSRLIFVHSEESGKKIPFPKPIDPEDTKILVEYMTRIRVQVNGLAVMSSTAEKLLEKIYLYPVPIDDVRFAYYNTRRFTHLLKLCLIVSAARLSTTIEECDVVYANTILTHTEHLMPKALGEFGKAKHSDVVHKIVQVLESSSTILSFKDIWKHVVQDLEKHTDLAELLRNLCVADKIQAVGGGFLPKKKVLVETTNDVVDYGLLTREELLV